MLEMERFYIQLLKYILVKNLIQERTPDFKHSYEDDLSIRYQKISEINGLDYYKIKGDSVDVKTHSKIVKKYISKRVLEESSYYKNLILKISELTKYFN